MQTAPSGVTEQSELAAEIRPRIESRLGFRVAGKITARRVELGQAVKPGQVLATLDGQDYRLSAEASQAVLNSAKVSLELAQSDYRRFKDLFDQNFSRAMRVFLKGPLGIAGVAAALLLLNRPIGFVALLGFIALSGMTMRNSVILIDQIEQDRRHGVSAFNAIVATVVTLLALPAMYAAWFRVKLDPVNASTA